MILFPTEPRAPGSRVAAGPKAARRGQLLPGNAGGPGLGAGLRAAPARPAAPSRRAAGSLRDAQALKLLPRGAIWGFWFLVLSETVPDSQVNDQRADLWGLGASGGRQTRALTVFI